MNQEKLTEKEIKRLKKLSSNLSYHAGKLQFKAMTTPCNKEHERLSKIWERVKNKAKEYANQLGYSHFMEPKYLVN